MAEFLNWDGPCVTANGSRHSLLGYSSLPFAVANRRKKQLALLTPFESWLDLGAHSYAPFLNFISDVIYACISVPLVTESICDVFFDLLQERCSDEDEAEIYEGRHKSVAQAGAIISSIVVVPLYIVAQFAMAVITAALTAISFFGRLLATMLNLGFEPHKAVTPNAIVPEVFEKVEDKGYHRLFLFRDVGGMFAEQAKFSTKDSHEDSVSDELSSISSSATARSTA